MLQIHIKVMVCFLLFLPLFCALYSSGSSRQPMTMHSNFNIDRTSSSEHSPIKLEDPLPLPIILTNPGEYKSNRPLFEKYSLRKYQLYDTNYLPDLSKISRLDEQLAYNMQPPTGVFEQCSKIVIENYRLLQIKEFKITLINPSQRYRFCVEEIFIDSEEITRQEKRPLPFCINSTTKYPFFFSLYITEHKPLIFKGTVYFIVTIYDGDELVDEKIWPKEIIVKVTHNHLRIIPLEIRNCNKDNSIVMIRNPQKWDLSLVIIYKRKLYELTGQPIDGNIVIPAQKSYKFIIDGKDSKMTIYTKSVAIDVTYPVLYVPIYCIQDLIVDYFNIGILSDDRSLLQFPVTVSSYSNSSIFIQQISLKSSTQTVELLPLRQKFNYYQVQANVRHFIVGRIVIHGSKANVQAQRSYFEVAIKYMMKADNRFQQVKLDDHSIEAKNNQQIEYQTRETKTTYHYCEMRSPISVGGKRFIDISKLNDGTATSVSENAFPIRNNLNLPINLIRVIYDESKFKLLWLQDRRDYIFPNHQRDQFSLQYIGPRNLQISPMKYVALLQFNGNLFIPLEITVYDRTLQCVYDDISNGKPIKCSDLPTIEFGYFNEQPLKQKLGDSSVQSSQQNLSKNENKQKPQSEQNQHEQLKTRRIAIRNWNPEAKNIKVGIQQNSVQKYGFNTTVRVLGPFPEYEVNIKTDQNIHEFYLKGNHYIVIEIQMVPLQNATSGTLPLRILTTEEHITKPIKFKVQNGTIALIPQISRFQSFYKKSIEYLNLVSTYKQPYRIKSISSNLSNLIVYSNNYSEIYENQWIGMALIYEPFMGEWNITEECCTERKGVQRIFRDLKVGGNRPTPVQIKLKTSTELEAVALVLIDRSSPPLIQLPYNHQFSIREKFRKDAQRIDIHLIDDGNMEKFEYKLKVRNLFQNTLKGNIMLFDEDLIERLDDYAEYRTKMNGKVISYFCLRNDVKVKHNFSPSLIKSLFQLNSLPVEITVEPLTNTSFYINSPIPPREEVVDSSKFSEYFRETINSGSRMCYKFETSLFVRNLIETGVVNWFSEEYRFEALNQFIKKQFEQLQFQAEEPQPGPIIYSFQHKQVYPSLTKYNLHYDQFFAHHYIDKEHFCKGERNYDKMTSLFRFCQHINIKMAYLDAQGEKIHDKAASLSDQCLNSTLGFDLKKQNKECKKDHKENLKRNRKNSDKQVSKYFLLPPIEHKSQQNGDSLKASPVYYEGLKKNELQLGFQIYPVRNRAPILTFSGTNSKYRTIIQNPHIPKQQSSDSQIKEESTKFKKSSAYSSQQEHEEPLFLTTPSFYLVLLNNYTSYQLYHQTIQISKPKLRVKSVIINNEMIDKNEFERNYFTNEAEITEGNNANLNRMKESSHPKDSTSSGKKLVNKGMKSIPYTEKSRWFPVYIQEKELKVKKHVQKSKNPLDNDINTLQQKKSVLEEELNLSFEYNPQEERAKVKQMLYNGNIENLYIEGQRVFEIANQGQADVSYTHIGFQNVELSCHYKGIRVIAGPCTENWQPQTPQENLNYQTESSQKTPNQDLKQNLSQSITYKLLPKSSSLIKIRYSISLVDIIASHIEKKYQKGSHKNEQFTGIYTTPVSVYLYNSHSYFIQFIIKFKLSTELETLLNNVSAKQFSFAEGQKFFLTKIWNISLNILAFLFICATIIKFREDEELIRRVFMKKTNFDFSSQTGNSKFPYPSNTSPISYQKAYKRMKLKNEFYNGQEGNGQENSQFSYQIIEPSLYPFTIGTPISHKSSNAYHPIVTISQQLLNLIKQEEKNEARSLHNYFNESEESEILAKNEHEINQNISLTINLDDVTENENQNNEKQNESISEESSFDFEIRNTSTSNDKQIGKHNESQDNDEESGSGSDFSQASESDLPDGQQVQVTDELLNESDEGFGFESESKKKPLNSSQTIEEESEDKKEGYYNVFFTENPLKKGKEQLNSSVNNPFSWMNESKKRSRLKW